MRNFDILLWDIDGTLLDFAAAESAAVKGLFREFGLGECSDGMVARYAAINKRWWEALERGEKTKTRDTRRALHGVLCLRGHRPRRRAGIQRALPAPARRYGRVLRRQL